MASIPIANVRNTERLPIDAQDVITRARLVIAGNRAGWEPDAHFTRLTTGGVGEFPTPPIPIPFAFEVDHADHDPLGCERSLALPEVVDPFLPPTSVGTPHDVEGFTDGSSAYDGDPGTFAASDLSGTSQIDWREYLTSPNDIIVGFRILFSLVLNDPSTGSRYAIGNAPGLVTMLHTATPASGYSVESRYAWAIQPNDEGILQDRYAIAPLDARGHPANRAQSVTNYSSLDLTVLQQAAGGTLHVYAFYPLIIDESLLEDVAIANLRAPAANPQRVVVTGYVPPDREHTIVGWPGGDFTGAVAQQQYELTQTVIDFDQAGAPVGLPAEARETALERSKSTSESIARASYGLKMGERQ